jgi:DNA-binding IclR family transcriptional regulator
MPGLTLTVRQAARLLGLSVSESERLLSDLVDSRFLTRDAGGRYRRRGCPRCA